ncbi:hypothetical protein EYF80_046977 [Liparis tanakae]|uniref:Uncharacterized protein n=1 Tax=Liparis tanakae TaxID=230148 RepID=A0A4Z2FNU6_9TELE|nr:hypothetical protein EYF80_046977 [Liparis tanakae]
MSGGRRQPAVASFFSTASNDVNATTLKVTRGNSARCIKKELITEVQQCGAFFDLFDETRGGLSIYRLICLCISLSNQECVQHLDLRHDFTAEKRHKTIRDLKLL